MSSLVIVGTQWGDEGKGKIVDIVSADADLVVRFQGGANAGHTVVINSDQFVLHLLPTGILHEGKVCVLGNGVVIDPKRLITEVDEVSKKGISVEGRLFVSEVAHITMPYHRLFDEAREIKRESRKIGTTHRGIGPTYTDKMARVGIRAIDLLYPEVFEEKLKANTEEKNFLLEKYYAYERVSFQSTLEEYREYAERMRPWIADTSVIVNEFISDGKMVLFEGAQGTLLDVDFGTYPFVTSSSTVAGGACTGVGVGPTKIDRVLGVTKAYTTRVGAGPFPTEFSEELDEMMRVKGREYGAATGRPRRCGWFDALVVRRAVRLSGIDEIAVTKLDVLDGMESLQICNGYKYKGEILREFPSQTAILDECEPVYEEAEGWAGSTRGARKLEEMPGEARKYLDRIAELVGAKIALVSVGPRRDEIVFTDSKVW
jgi:adenylosuccinate synthase